jgi:hypothetical protein
LKFTPPPSQSQILTDTLATLFWCRHGEASISDIAREPSRLRDYPEI